MCHSAFTLVPDFAWERSTTKCCGLSLGSNIETSSPSSPLPSSLASVMLSTATPCPLSSLWACGRSLPLVLVDRVVVVVVVVDSVLFDVFEPSEPLYLQPRTNNKNRARANRLEEAFLIRIVLSLRRGNQPGFCRLQDTGLPPISEALSLPASTESGSNPNLCRQNRT